MARFDVSFVLVPRFSMIALYGAVEPLRVANRFAGEAFSWRFVSADGAPVAASNGIPVSVGGDLGSLGKPAMAVFAASYEHEAGVTRAMMAAVRKLARQKVMLAAFDTGPFLLARAGALDGYRATCHWESLPGFRESFPQVTATESLYEQDRDRLTSAGGAATIDMMLGWIGGLMGQGLAVTVADQLIHFRGGEDLRQVRTPAQFHHATRDPRLLVIISAMEQHMEEPLAAEELAAQAGLSTRSMERLFRDQLKARPMGFYRRMRLARAEQLLNYSPMSVRDVSLATGFSTLAEFSRAFRAWRGQPPSALRRSVSPLPSP